MTNGIVIIYGTALCAGCPPIRQFLERHGVPYEYIDIQSNYDAKQIVERVTGGEHVTPVVLFPDGSTLVEPTDHQLALRLGIADTAAGD